MRHFLDINKTTPQDLRQMIDDARRITEARQGQPRGTSNGQPETQTAIEQLFRDLFGAGRN